MTRYVTACPRNCYSTCAMRVTVENGRLRAVEPCDGNPATATGPCLKGLSYVERQHSPDRILTPLRRTGSGGFAPTDWNSALDEISETLGRIRAESGPRSLLFYEASGTKGLLNGCALDFWRAYGGCTTTYGDLCWPAGLEATRLTLGENLHNAPGDLANAELIVMWGKNPAETNIHQMVFIDQALDRGAELVVIDPRRTQTADRAGRLIQPRPGSDGILAQAVARCLIETGGVDGDFVADHVLGFDAYADLVRERSLSEAAAICDVPEATIRGLAALLAERRPATICAGFGMQRYTNSGQTMRNLIALAAITGNIGRPGGGWIYANLQTQVFGGPRDPLAFFPPETPDGVVRVSISTARLGDDMLAQTDPPLRAAWVERGNPLAQNPDTNRVREAFRALEFRVVVDQFLTDTAREADIVLPAKTMFEQTDVIGAYWHAYLQLRPRIIDPPGGVRPETEIYRALAERLGCGPVDIPGPDDADVRRWLERRLSPLGLSLADFDRGPVPAPGCVDVAFEDRIFPTPSGRIELLSEEAAARWGVDPLPRCEPPTESALRGDHDPGTPLQMMTPNTKDRIHSQFGNLDLIRANRDEPRLQINPADARDRGIGPEARVRVHNARGALYVRARIDSGIRRGCVSLSNGWWSDEAGPVNLLSEGRETDIAHGAAFHDNLVQVEAVEGGAT